MTVKVPEGLPLPELLPVGEKAPEGEGDPVKDTVMLGEEV